MTSPAGSAIEACGLTKRFGSTLALDRLDLQVPRGCVLGYLGPNGAGKTTTIKLATGLWRPTAGTITVLGQDATRDRDVVQARLGYLPGDFQGYPGMTGHQFLRLLGKLRGGVDATFVASLAHRFHLDLDRRIGTLSHGNRQKVGIIQAFMHRPELLVLDEPTIGLDPLMQREFLSLVRESRNTGATVLLSSHILSEVAAVADRVAVINEGRLVLDQPVDALRARALRRVELTFTLYPPVDAIERVPGVRSVALHGSSAEVMLRGSVVPLLEAVTSRGLVDVVSHEADLADVFLGLYDGTEVVPDGVGLHESALGAAS
jgi:ABC-2 type transport system ATP-binding protein